VIGAPEGAPGGHLQSVAPRRPRVVLLAEQRLVGDAVRAALSSRYLDVVLAEWPAAHRPPAVLRRTVTSLRPQAGLVFGDLEDPWRRAQTRMLVATVPLRWVLVVSHHDEVTWGDIVDAGATLLPTWISLDDLSAGLARLMAGGDLMEPGARQRIVRGWRVRRDEMDEVAQRLARLTPREAEVLHLLSAGLSVRRIAELRDVAETTVRTQVKAVLRKLEVTSQLAAVALVARARPEDVPAQLGDAGYRQDDREGRQ
jgi:DNA-binding NarL/FixJ family response regulator